jgi:hypothetical protein
VLVVAAILLALKIAVILLVDELPWYIRRELAAKRAAQVQLSARQRLTRFTEAVQCRTRTADWSPQRDLGFLDTVRSSAGILEVSHQLASGAKHLGMGHAAPPPPQEAPQEAHHSHLDVEAEKEIKAQEAARDAAIARLLDEQVTQKFGFDPFSLSLLVSLPVLLPQLGVPAWAYLPAAVLYFSYLSAEKMRNDHKMAIGIVTDPHLVKLGNFSYFLYVHVGVRLYLTKADQQFDLAVHSSGVSPHDFPHNCFPH